MIMVELDMILQGKSRGRIVCSDCLEVISKLPNEILDLVIADPPYGRIGGWPWIENWIEAIYGKIQQNGSIYIFCGIGEKSDSLSKILPIIKDKFIFKNLITWKKQRGYGTQRNWMYTREEIIFAVKSKDYYFKVLYGDKPRPQFKTGRLGKIASSYKPLSEFKRITNIWDDIQEITPGVGNKPEWLGHPTQKPEKLMERIILASSKENDLVFDPFMGSGTTAVVADRLNRRWFGCDIEQKYVDMALERIRKDRESRPLF